MIGIHRDAKHMYSLNGEGKVPGITTAMKARDESYQLKQWRLMQTALAAIANIENWQAHLEHVNVDPMCAVCMAGWKKDGTPQERAARWLTGWPGYVSQPKMDLGSAIHAIAESLARGEPVDCASIPDGQMPFVESFIRDFVEGGKTPGKAKPRFHPKYIEYTVYRAGDEWCEPYGGTMDVACRLGDDVVCIDYKTGSGVWDEVRLQLSAGSNGTYAGELCPGCKDESGKTRHYETATFDPPPVTAHAILHIRPEGAEYIPYRITPLDFKAFAAARALWQWDKEWRKAA